MVRDGDKTGFSVKEAGSFISRVDYVCQMIES